MTNRNLKILVFGKTGQVARELQKQYDVIALGREDADLSNPVACASVITDLRPDCVINAAAYTAVDQAEDEGKLAHTINAASPGMMAGACAHLRIPFLHISTDYVFDGSGIAAWKETDPVSPQNVYGRTKLEGEEVIRASGASHIILRCSWIFSEHGSNFVKTMLRLASTHDMLKVVDDQIGGPTAAADIAQTLLILAQAVHSGANGGTYHYAGMPFVSWAQFAQAIFEGSNIDLSVTGIPSSDYPTPAQRPLNSRLDSKKIKDDFGIKPCDWRPGLETVVKELLGAK